jgi:hypothetical protein
LAIVLPTKAVRAPHPRGNLPRAGVHDEVIRGKLNFRISGRGFGWREIGAMLGIRD